MQIMKNVLVSLLCCLGIVACRRVSPVYIDVERSTLYHGQTVVSVYDNFGVPKKQFIDMYGVRELHYKFEEIQQYQLDKKFCFCDLIVYLDDDIVVDWEWRGNKCHVEVEERDFTLDTD